jgi:hypothetical protein
MFDDMMKTYMFLTGQSARQRAHTRGRKSTALCEYLLPIVSGAQWVDV